MDLKLNKQSFNAYKSRKMNSTIADKTLAPFKNQAKNISFKGDISSSFIRTVNKANNCIQYTNAQKIVQDIDSILGSDDFFSNALFKAGLIKKTADGKFDIPETLELRCRKISTDLFNTLAFPFLELPVRAYNFVSRKLGGPEIITQHLKDVEVSKSYRLCQDILDKYTSLPNTQKIYSYLDKYAKSAEEKIFSSANQSFDFQKCSERFKDHVAFDVNKLFKGYDSRDERTLNRMATSTVSALYSANDFYNISMLQKDDKNEAKKAHKSRFKQEMTRMMLSAGMTFITLGVLDKIVKRNIVINAVVIALSSLISEVGSRLFNGTPLYPLSPEQAKKIAQERKIAKQKQDASKQENAVIENSSAKTVQFKGTDENNKNNVFVQFASKDGTFASMNSLFESAAKEGDKNSNKPKKKMSLSKILGIAAFACSAFYLISRALKGEFSAKIARKKLYESSNVKDEIIKYLNNTTETLPDETAKKIEKIKSTLSEKTNRFSFEKKFKDRFLTYNSSFSVNELKERVEGLKKLDEGKEIKPILDEFLENIAKLKDEVSKTGSKSSLSVQGDDVIINYKKDIPVLPGLYNGVTKVFKTVYQILSAPGMLAEMLVDKTYFKETEMAFNALKAKGKKFGLAEFKKELIGLNNLTSKRGWSDEKILDYIKKNTRTFEESAETGELANLSRTMVTAISTYFFVNDYTNKVLIESEGRDIETAKEERNERLAHKVSNFVINGTLMNLFNSVFKFPLNRSLVDATLIAAATETTNEFFVRKSICQPFRKMNSKEDIIKYENEQMNKKGFMGWWSRTFKKLTGKKSLTQKVNVSGNDTKKDK